MERRDVVDGFEVFTRNYAPQTDIDVRVDRRGNYPLVEVTAVKKPSAKRAPRAKRGRSGTPHREVARFGTPPPLHLPYRSASPEPLPPQGSLPHRSPSRVPLPEQRNPPLVLRVPPNSPAAPFLRFGDKVHYAVAEQEIDEGGELVAGGVYRFVPPLTDAQYKKALQRIIILSLEHNGKVGPPQIVNAIADDERFDRVLEELGRK